MAKTKPCKPLVLNELLIQNVNTWGNVQYNIPLRVTSNETRTGTNIALRHIPDIPHNFDCVSCFKYLEEEKNNMYNETLLN